MKICKKFVWCMLAEFERGDVVEMKAPVNQYCKADDLYLVSEIPHCYLRDAEPNRTSWVLYDKIPVTNLRTGGISMVQDKRPCRGRPNARIVEGS